jgi:methionyl-tRNA formyltransferase
LAALGAALLMEVLPLWLAGQIQPQPQNNDLASLAPRLKKEEGEIDWNRPAVEIERQVRAFSPWPGTFTQGPRDQIKILAVELASEVTTAASPGTIFRHDRQVYVAAGQGALRLVTVQPAGKKAMPAEAMLNGQPELLNQRLGMN